MKTIYALFVLVLAGSLFGAQPPPVIRSGWTTNNPPSGVTVYGLTLGRELKYPAAIVGTTNADMTASNTWTKTLTQATNIFITLNDGGAGTLYVTEDGTGTWLATITSATTFKPWSTNQVAALKNATNASSVTRYDFERRGSSIYYWVTTSPSKDQVDFFDGTVYSAGNLVLRGTITVTRLTNSGISMFQDQVTVNGDFSSYGGTFSSSGSANFDNLTLTNTVSWIRTVTNSYTATATNFDLSCSAGNIQFLLMTNNLFLRSVLSPKFGTYLLWLKQDTTGTRSLGYQAAFTQTNANSGFTSGIIPVDTNANAWSLLTCVLQPDGTNFYSTFQTSIKN